MITMILPVPIGNAVKIYVDPVHGATEWSVYKKGNPIFNGKDDEESVHVFTGNDTYYLDDFALQNDVQYFYKIFNKIGSDWVEGNTVAVTPRYEIEDLTIDPLSALKDRIDLGFQQAIKSDEIKAISNYIPVFVAPPALNDNTPFPCISLIYSNESSAYEALSQDVIGDSLNDDDSIFDGFGYLGDFTIDIGLWSLNPEQRRDMRKIARRIILANADIWSSYGFINVEFRSRDDDMMEMTPPLYLVLGTFKCMAPVAVGSRHERDIKSINVVGFGD